MENRMSPFGKLKMQGYRAFVLASLAIGASLCAPLHASAATAQAYPAKPIRLIVPFPPGGAADIVARVIGRPLSDMLGQPVMVENKPGADGAIAAETVAKAEPDGYTLFMATYGAMSAVPALHKHARYDAIADFTPITSAGKFALFLFVHPSVPARTLAELIDYAHAHPGALNYGTGNTGAIIATAELSSMAKMDMIHVPYKGEVPAMADFLTGRVQLMFATPANALAQVKEGKLRALVTLLDARSPLLPDVPTMAESGMHGLSIDPWAGLFGPANMPKPITDRLSLSVNAILAREDVRGELAKQGFAPAASTPGQLAAYVKEQLQVWNRSVHDAGIETD
jgi:tripartite-type tricarboxylate transporter receptor subunit TctC